MHRFVSQALDSGRNGLCLSKNRDMPLEMQLTVTSFLDHCDLAHLHFLSKSCADLTIRSLRRLKQFALKARRSVVQDKKVYYTGVKLVERYCSKLAVCFLLIVCNLY